MKLKICWVKMNELQDYLDKYQSKIKFINMNTGQISGQGIDSVMLIIDKE